MAEKKSQKGGWLLATFFAFSILVGLYAVLLFPVETTTLIAENSTYIAVTLLTILLTGFIILFLQKNKSKGNIEQNLKKEKKVKLIEQLIWRNRYVLQTKKALYLDDYDAGDRAKWHGEKLVFARKYIYPKVAETEVSFNIVSELIEKSLNGGAIGGIRPPTYSVRNISR